MRHAGAFPAGATCNCNSVRCPRILTPGRTNCRTVARLIGWRETRSGEGAAHGSPRRGRRIYVVSMDTSVPGQQDASDAALVDMLMLEAPVGLALFGSDLRFRWVNAALTRLAEGPAPSDPHPDPSAWAGRLPSEAWPEQVASRAEAALRTVLEEGM